jgi:hypothetical protein
MYSDIHVNCHPNDIQRILLHVFHINGFGARWFSPGGGRAQKGNLGMNLLLGALATHSLIDFQLFMMPDGTHLLRLTQSNTTPVGWWSYHAGKDQFYKIVDMLTNYFISSNCFIGRFPQ